MRCATCTAMPWNDKRCALITIDFTSVHMLVTHKYYGFWCKTILGYSLKKTATTLKHASSWDVYQVLCALYVLVWNVGQCKVKLRTESPNRVPGRVFLRETLAPKQKRSELQTRLITAEILKTCTQRWVNTHIIEFETFQGYRCPHTHTKLNDR